MTEAKKKILKIIRENLEYGDQKKIALELNVLPSEVCETLQGKRKSKKILNALINKAKENQQNDLLIADQISKPIIILD